MMKDLLSRSISALIILPFSLFFILKGGFFFILFLIICLILSLIEWNNMKKNKILTILGNMFIFFSFFSTYQIRFNPENDQNLIFFLLIILVCISTDVGGYIFGKVFKGPKLTKISPNKTYAGAVGGFLSSLILIYLISIYLESFYKFNLELISYILFISLISQIGDLIVSYFKRLSNIKDTGKLIPGHGGILDRIDGMIFAFPIIFIFELLF